MLVQKAELMEHVVWSKERKLPHALLTKLSVSLDSSQYTFSAFVFLVGFHNTVHDLVKNTKTSIPMHFYVL